MDDAKEKYVGGLKDLYNKAVREAQTLVNDQQIAYDKAVEDVQTQISDAEKALQKAIAALDIANLQADADNKFRSAT